MAVVVLAMLRGGGGSCCRRGSGRGSGTNSSTSGGSRGGLVGMVGRCRAVIRCFLPRRTPETASYTDLEPTTQT